MIYSFVKQCPPLRGRHLVVGVVRYRIKISFLFEGSSHE